MSSTAQTLGSWVRITLDRGMDFCPRFFCVCVVLCRQQLWGGLITRPKRPTVYKIHNFRINSDGNRLEGLIRQGRRSCIIIISSSSTTLVTRVVHEMLLIMLVRVTFIACQREACLLP
jgi:hypothetical protein